MATCIVGSKNPVKINAARNALSKVLSLPALDAVGLDVSSRVRDQPMTSAETRLGAVNRVKACLGKSDSESRNKDWFVAIEGGGRAI